MYCVIQEMSRKKPDCNGHYKKIEVSHFTADNNPPKYFYTHCGERFERPVKKAYKVSIHDCKRVCGVVTKKQFVATTIGFYQLAKYSYRDFVMHGKVCEIANKLNATDEQIWTLLDDKILPLADSIKAEFHQTEEYKTYVRNEAIIREYKAAKAEFGRRYGNAEDYDYCYDVFGILRNKERLNQIIQAHKDKCNNDYKSSDNRHYKHSYGKAKTFANEVSDDEKMLLKKFYRVLSKQFHPDKNPNADTTVEMQLVNKLKDDWGL